MTKQAGKLDPNSNVGYAFRKYFSKMGDVNLSTEVMNIEADKLITLVGKEKGEMISNLLTYGFKTSDLQARSVLLSASVKHFESGLKKFGHLKNSDNIAFRNGMKKHLGLDTFYGKDMYIDDIMLSLTHKNEKETAFKFAELTVNTALFDYRTMSKPQFSQLAKKGEVYSAATVFSSWSLYYANKMKSYVGAASQGNYKPLAGLLGTATLWYYGMSELADSDNYFVQNFGRKGVSRTPGVAGVMLPYTFAAKPMGGMMVNPFGTLLSGFTKPMSLVNDRINKNKDMFDMMSNEMMRRKGPIAGLVDEMGRTFGQIKGE